ncbi:MAG: isoprenylcysteine carboxylmethyltransferase family protein [Pseudomonadota bacterium]
MESFARVFLAVFFGFLTLHYTAVLVGRRMRSGDPLVETGSIGTPQYRANRVFVVFRWLIFAIVWARLFVPEVDDLLFMFDMLVAPVIQLSGCLMLAIGFFVVDFTHNFMGADWRSGAQARSQAMLVTSGPYAVIRNPMFIGVMVAQVGFFLALPSVFTLLCTGVGVAVLLAQSRLEELVLSEQFGPIYEAYKARTPGWLPADQGRTSYQGGDD